MVMPKSLPISTSDASLDTILPTDNSRSTFSILVRNHLVFFKKKRNHFLFPANGFKLFYRKGHYWPTIWLTESKTLLFLIYITNSCF